MAARFRPFIETEQSSALIMRRIFTPHDHKERILRAAMLRLMRAPVIGPATGKLMNGADMRNKTFDVATG
ncbi:hypothetical protein [Nonomuraea sp. NPDC050786]|uniref:hypothetical protein n=1 Tax=Nonomuraea sp. NPDC050786 TaxID=3154840 RepID=UPI0033E74067